MPTFIKVSKNLRRYSAKYGGSFVHGGLGAGSSAGKGAGSGFGAAVGGVGLRTPIEEGDPLLGDAVLTGRAVGVIGLAVGVAGCAVGVIDGVEDARAGLLGARSNSFSTGIAQRGSTGARGPAEADGAAAANILRNSAS